MCGTYLMRIGLPGVIFADFKWLGILQGLYLLTTIVVGVLRIAAWQEKPAMDPRDLWDYSGFAFAYVLQGVLAALYYHQVLYTSFRLAEEKYYASARGPRICVTARSPSGLSACVRPPRAD